MGIGNFNGFITISGNGLDVRLKAQARGDYKEGYRIVSFLASDGHWVAFAETNKKGKVSILSRIKTDKPIKSEYVSFKKLLNDKDKFNSLGYIYKFKSHNTTNIDTTAHFLEYKDLIRGVVWAFYKQTKLPYKDLEAQAYCLYCDFFTFRYDGRRDGGKFTTILVTYIRSRMFNYIRYINHTTSWSGEYCPDCNYRFSGSNNRNIHTGDFVCPQCGTTCDENTVLRFVKNDITKLCYTPNFEQLVVEDESRCVDFRMMLNTLSEEAQLVLSTIFNTPHEFITLGDLKTKMRSRGWKWDRINGAFTEIKSMLKEF